MAKSDASHRSGSIRDRSQVQYDRGHEKSTDKNVRRQILFPTEPSTIGHKKIDRAVERVVSRKK